MPQPYNYSTGIQDPTQTISNALQLRGTITEQKAAQQSLESKQHMQATLDDLATSPTSAKISAAMLRYPSLSEPLKRSLDSLTAEQKDNKISQAGEVYAALSAGENKLAQDLLLRNAEAARNSGDEALAKSLETHAQLVELHPESAKMTGGLFLASAMGPDKFAETYTKLEQERRDTAKAPAELSEAQAKAQKAGVDAKFAESNAALDLQKKGWDISKIQSDIDINRQNVKIAALNAGLNRESNDLKRQELQQKLDDAKLERESKISEKAAAVESSQATIDNSLSTIDRVLKNPALKDVIGPLEGRSGYPTTGAALAVNLGSLGLAGSSPEDRSNAIADLDTIKSQTFLSQLVALKNSSVTGASGLGALSKEEGQKLIDGVQSLDTRQGEKQFQKNLGEVQRLLLKMRANVAKKYGVPDSIPDRPEVQTTPEAATSEIPVPSTEGFKVIGKR